jgi:hypothetical protein
MHALSERYPRFGSRQSAALLRSAHWRVGRETVRRRWQREGLQVVQRRGKKRSVGGSTTTPKRATQYYLRIGTAKQRRSFAFAYIPIPTLPSGTSREVVFRSAIAACQEDTLRAVLNDLYRWLVFSNFAGFTSHTTPGTRKQILHTMDVVYPYGGALREAEDFAASYHPFGDTQGAVLYLLMHSQNAQDVNHRLGGILVAVLEHAHFKKYGVPTIDRLTNTALS